tara:strand:- start:977 stop:1162 length:186 start_codon:yes stop_codon:yes gene_type:complete
MISFSLLFFMTGIIMIFISLQLSNENVECSEKTKIIIDETPNKEKNKQIYSRPLFNTEITL